MAEGEEVGGGGGGGESGLAGSGGGLWAVLIYLFILFKFIINILIYLC